MSLFIYRVTATCGYLTLVQLFSLSLMTMFDYRRSRQTFDGKFCTLTLLLNVNFVYIP